MPTRPTLVALLALGLAGHAAASSWICSDPDADTCRQDLERARMTISLLQDQKAEMYRRYEDQAARLRAEIDGLRLANETLSRRLGELSSQVAPAAPRGWAQVIEDLRRNGDVNVGLTPILDRMESRGLASHRLRRVLQRLARFDGVLEAALETNAPERELERFGVVLDKVERHADELAAEATRFLERLHTEHGAEFAPGALKSCGLDDDLGDLDLGGDVDCALGSDALGGADDIDLADDFGDF